MVQVNWIKNRRGVWLPFPAVNLEKVYTTGVYIIWRKLQGYAPRVVRVGQGVIADRLGCHKNDATIMVQCTKGIGAWVTWAEIPANCLDGVEKYLADHYDPIIGERFPDVLAREVNLPF